VREPLAKGMKHVDGRGGSARPQEPRRGPARASPGAGARRRHRSALVRGEKEPPRTQVRATGGGEGRRPDIRVGGRRHGPALPRRGGREWHWGGDSAGRNG